MAQSQSSSISDVNNKRISEFGCYKYLPSADITSNNISLFRKKKMKKFRGESKPANMSTIKVTNNKVTAKKMKLLTVCFFEFTLLLGGM